jgi:hypothetical protein
MLIYEPKKYPDLNPNIGDMVYEYLTGKELGVVSCIDHLGRFIRYDIGHAERIIRISGLSSPAIDPYVSVTSLYECWTQDIITSYSVKKSLRIKC